MAGKLQLFVLFCLPLYVWGGIPIPAETTPAQQTTGQSATEQATTAEQNTTPPTTAEQATTQSTATQSTTTQPTTTQPTTTQPTTTQPTTTQPTTAKQAASAAAASLIISALLSDDILASEVCGKSDCPQGELCYYSHPQDCRKYVMCEMFENKGYRGQIRPCGFGTFWHMDIKGGPSCNRADLVDCPNDKCRNKTTPFMYEHEDKHCRTNWKCEGGKSFPDCCPRHHRFSSVEHKCVYDKDCNDTCPLTPTETCAGREDRNIHTDDDNCKSYIMCRKGVPYETCCLEGEGYDSTEGKCVQNAACTDKCKHDCPHEPTKDKNKYYDRVGHAIMQCSAGTIFNYTDCACKRDPDQVPVQPIRTDCPVAIDVMPEPGIPGLYQIINNLGTVFAAILKKGSGTLEEGSTFDNRTTAYFDGRSSIEIPYYGSQDPRILSLEMTIKPKPTSSATREVIVSSCMVSADKTPTFEVTIDALPNAGTYTLNVRAASQGKTYEAKHSIRANVWEKVNILYNGSKFLSQVMPADSAGGSGGPKIIKDLSGPIQIGRSGLVFGGTCSGEEGKSQGFVGDIYQFKFTKCLTKNQKAEL